MPLTLILGPMFSGKTTELLRLYRAAELDRLPHEVVALVKPTIDTRYSETAVVAHDGKAAACVRTDAFPMTASRVFVDEAQFAAPAFVDGLLRASANGTVVVAAGLNMDHLGNPWPVVQQLRRHASGEVHLAAKCAVCGLPATYSYRRGDLDSRVLLGGAESYQPMCEGHWVNQMIKRGVYTLTEHYRRYLDRAASVAFLEAARKPAGADVLPSATQVAAPSPEAIQRPS